jgi:LacI family transcriptional regulator
LVGDVVLPDNAGGARAIGQALLGLGHREFGVIAGQALLTATRDRLEGFRSALAEAGVELPRANIVDGDFSRDGGKAATELLLQRAPAITAIFALNDTMAIGALAALRERRIVVPDDISVVGFDDIPITRDLQPAISTVRVPMAEMGARAMELALTPAGGDVRIEHMPTELVLRASTAPPRR